MLGKTVPAVLPSSGNDQHHPGRHSWGHRGLHRRGLLGSPGWAYHPVMGPTRVILLPGSVLPAQPAYGALIEALGTGVQAVAKDLELYADDKPPPGWSLDTEVDAVLREADSRGWETFHLVGYSGGGAAALAL